MLTAMTPRFLLIVLAFLSITLQAHPIERKEFSVNITPTKLIPLSGSSVTNALPRPNFSAGFATSDIRAIFLSKNKIRFENHTSRQFQDIAFVSGKSGYLITQPLNAFSALEFSTPTQLFTSSEQTAHFLDPNPQFRSSPELYGASTTPTDVESYQLLLSHVKLLYRSDYLQDSFFDYFTQEHGGTEQQAINNWHTMITYSQPKVHAVHHPTSMAAGVASNGALYINWPMTYFNADRSYTYIYDVFVHENAHTQGYSHASGMTTGWDEYIDVSARAHFRRGWLTPGVINTETSNVYLFVNPHTLTVSIYQKEEDTQNINKVSLYAGKDLIVHSDIIDGEFFIPLLHPSHQQPPILFEANQHWVRDQYTAIVDSSVFELQYQRAPIYFLINEPNLTFWQDQQIYFFIPPQEQVISSDVINTPTNYSTIEQAGYSSLTLNIKNVLTGLNYPVALLGWKGAFPIDNAHGTNNRLFFQFEDINVINALPRGLYQGEFALGVGNLTESNTDERVTIKFQLDKTKYDYLSLAQISKAYGISSTGESQTVFFFVPPQDGVTTNGASSLNEFISDGLHATTAITLTVTDDFGLKHPIKLKGKKLTATGFVKLEDTSGNSEGKMIIELDTDDPSLALLPSSRNYRASLLLIAKTPNNNTGTPIEVDVRFSR